MRPVIASARTLVLGLITVLAFTVIALILNANVFSNVSDAYKYARLVIPGSSVVQLPHERLEVILEDPLGNGVDVPRGLSASDSEFSLDLGHGPPISSAAIWAIGGIAGVALVLAWLLAR